MGSFYPLVSRAMTGGRAPGPYATTFWFAIGVAACSLVANSLLMRHPLDGGEPVQFGAYARAQAGWHVWAFFGGLIWCTGAVLNFAASQAHIVGPAVFVLRWSGRDDGHCRLGSLHLHEFARSPPPLEDASGLDVLHLSRRADGGGSGSGLLTLLDMAIADAALRSVAKECCSEHLRPASLF